MCECCGGDCRLMDKQKELSDAYKKIYDNFDDFVNMVRKDVGPYEEIKNIIKADRAVVPIPANVKTYMLPNELIHKLQDIGRIEEKLLNLTEDQIFENLSKHDEYWSCEDPDTSDKLDELRMKFGYINDKIWDIISIIRKDEQEC